MTGTAEITDWYMRLLTPLSEEVKINLIKNLSESLLNIRYGKNKTPKEEDIFAGLSSAWQDGTSAEEETRKIRTLRQTDVTRHINAL